MRMLKGDVWMMVVCGIEDQLLGIAVRESGVLKKKKGISAPNQLGMMSSDI